MKNLLGFILLFLLSCGGKDSGNNTSHNRANSSLEQDNSERSSDSHVDSDGDGILDKEDERPFIADIPIIGGEFFNRMKVEIWSTGSRTARVAKWQIDWNGIEVNETSGNEATKRPRPRSMVDYYLKKGARASNWKIEQVPIEIQTDYLINSFPSPILTRGEMLKISDELKNQRINDTLSARVDFQADLTISSKSHRYFKDLTLNVFFITPKGEVREIDNLYIEGHYEFNQVLRLNNRINIMDQLAVESLIVSGSRLFVKVSDFTIIDSNERYSALLGRVRNKSIPLLVSDGRTNPETFFIGLQGRESSLNSILTRAFGVGQVRMSGSSVDSVRGISNRLTRRDGDWGNEFSQWVLGTNTFFSPFSYDFTTSDTIVMGYYSNYEPDTFPIYMQRKDLAKKDFQISGNQYFVDQDFNLEDVSQRVEMVFSPRKFTIPKQRVFEFTRSKVCGSRDIWMTDMSWNTGYEVDQIESDFGEYLKGALVEISNEDGIILSENVEDSQVVEMNHDKATNEFVLNIPDLWKFGGKLGRVNARIILALPREAFRVGEKENRRVCNPIRTSPPHIGNELSIPTDFFSSTVSTVYVESVFDGHVTVLGY